MYRRACGVEGTSSLLWIEPGDVKFDGKGVADPVCGDRTGRIGRGGAVVMLTIWRSGGIDGFGKFFLVFWCWKARFESKMGRSP